MIDARHPVLGVFFYSWVILEGEKRVDALFTKEEIEAAIQRAEEESETEH